MLFALAELILDLNYLQQTFCKVDLESMHIIMCVTDASMRTFMLDPETREAVMTTVNPPDSIRGSISRRTIADKTGLPRETVRRKISELAELGLLQIDAAGRVRASQLLGDPALQRTLEGGHAAILRYLARLKSLGVE